MAILAHAQHQDVDGRQFGQRRIGQAGRLFQARRTLVEAEEARPGGFALQQVTAHQPFVAVRMADRHPALVGQADGHLRPVEHLAGQPLEKSHRAAPTGHHQHGRATGIDGRAQGVGHGDGQFTGQLFGAAEGEPGDLRRQVEITDRHTSSCHHG
ncbi:hypothetical protein D9M71_547230 [compost metagenome]